jgi:hypothetical protein
MAGSRDQGRSRCRDPYLSGGLSDNFEGVTRHGRSTAGARSTSATVQLFADEVETLGVEHYPATFAGATLGPTGVTDVYAVAASDGNLVNAVKALDRHRYPVKVVAVRRGYSQLMAISAKLLRAHSQLKTEGVNLAQWGPDAASGTVKVTLRKPAASGMSALASAQGAPVTSSNYRAEASAVLKQQAGAGITLRSQYATGLPVLASRDGDTAPYFDGDLIFHVGAGVTCTSGFNLIGSGGGQYMVTAGHCGSGTWKTHASTVGNTSLNYLTATSGNDFQITYLAGGGLGVVWTNGTNTAPVTGALFPAVGAPITFNGGITGEVRGVTVQAVSQSQCFSDPSTGGTICATNLTKAEKSGTVCQPGDSGGPVYSHTPSANVLAVGIIEGGDGSTCYATQIDHIAFITGRSLLTG